MLQKWQLGQQQRGWDLQGGEVVQDLKHVGTEVILPVLIGWSILPDEKNKSRVPCIRVCRWCMKYSGNLKLCTHTHIFFIYYYVEDKGNPVMPLRHLGDTIWVCIFSFTCRHPTLCLATFLSPAPEALLLHPGDSDISSQIRTSNLFWERLVVNPLFHIGTHLLLGRMIYSGQTNIQPRHIAVDLCHPTSAT